VCNLCIAANTCLGRPSVFHLCENRQGTLRCPKGKVIVVAYANYGRTAKGVCRHNSMKTTRCYSRKSKILIRKACHGENKCALNARNSVYGDPCYGTYKYIEVLYHCSYLSSALVFRLCENRQGTLRCPKGKVIVVAYANYGRTAKGVCRHNSIKTTRCYSSKSKILIRKACHGENKCALNARNSVYGDPCYGTYKYIEVLYHCSRLDVFRLCENRQGTLRCPKGKVIVVAYANYGRTAKGVCRHNSIKTTRCYSSKSKILIRKACHGENKCALNARNSVYGDPCYGTYKYIEVLYHCV
ncbi:predicted protein, partial [Nematostella vectensis]